MSMASFGRFCPSAMAARIGWDEAILNLGVQGMFVHKLVGNFISLCKIARECKHPRHLQCSRPGQCSEPQPLQRPSEPALDRQSQRPPGPPMSSTGLPFPASRPFLPRQPPPPITRALVSIFRSRLQHGTALLTEGPPLAVYLSPTQPDCAWRHRRAARKRRCSGRRCRIGESRFRARASS